jgi:hypothetical protein
VVERDGMMGGISATAAPFQVKPCASHKPNDPDIPPRMGAPEPLIRFARRAAEFDFSQLLEEEVGQMS